MRLERANFFIFVSKYFLFKKICIFVVMFYFSIFNEYLNMMKIEEGFFVFSFGWVEGYNFIPNSGLTPGSVLRDYSYLWGTTWGTGD